ncbi:MAG TPA: hypothetical protein VNO30_48990 [Kofleriaceae bacterium]|nr:hypothetical protein [Kofleriaceae bacterium]
MVAYLQSVAPTVALPGRRVARVEDIVWKPIDEALREQDDAFLITPARFAPEMKVHRNEEGFAADVVVTPALLYTRGRLVTPQRLLSTSLSAGWDYLADDQKTVMDKPADFIRWGKRVMQWVRRVAPSWYRYKHHRITPKAEMARDTGMEMIF